MYKIKYNGHTWNSHSGWNNGLGGVWIVYEKSA